MTEQAAFYTIADDSFFIGLVALINSLRLVGHTEPIYVLDCGLTDWQQALLDRAICRIPAPKAHSPILLKPYAPLLHPAEVMVLLDADVIVLRSLHELIEQARVEKRVITFECDPVSRSRFSEHWGEILGLGRIRRESYVSVGHFVLPRTLGTSILELMDELQTRIDLDTGTTLLDDWAARSEGRRLPGSLDNPFYYPEQDIFNAILGSHVEHDDQLRLNYHLAPFTPFTGIRIIDRTTLQCAYTDGMRPYLLHHASAKPWLARTHPNVFTRLLPRLLFSSDLTIRLLPDQVPLRFRPGPRGAVERSRLYSILLLSRSYWRTRAALRIRTRLRELRVLRSG